MRDEIEVLILVAHGLELGRLQTRLPPTSSGQWAGTVGGRRLAACAIGVGLPAAAVGTCAALQTFAPAAVLLLGSYGRYVRTASGDAGDALTAPIDLLVPTDVTALDAGVLAGLAAFPAPMPVARALDARLGASLASACGASRGNLGVTSAITIDDALAARLAEGGCVGENLEVLGVALGCERYAAPFTALLACTNDVGARGREQWRARHQAAADATSAAALAWVQDGFGSAS